MCIDREPSIHIREDEGGGSTDIIRHWLGIASYPLNKTTGYLDTGWPFAALYGKLKKAYPTPGAISCFYVWGDAGNDCYFYSFEELKDALRFIKRLRKKYTAIEAPECQRKS
jgi:hypothetical protein